ncbi:hypothetical protein J1605_014191 [Eschrichtius robustus]|uniref:Uncharacterized protein n=1 Tax=Eschrichtius robustus TaxID=9764 RepID=A0AB34GES9_ESCRO|nr:hypothetical protein J1605_014191 [Eschrichtius robustus]
MQGLGAWAGRPRPRPALSEPVPRLHPPGQPSGTEGLCWQPGPGTPVQSGVCLPNPAAACPPQCHEPHKPWGRVEKPSFVVQVRVPTPGSHGVLPGGQERAAHQSPPPRGPRPYPGSQRVPWRRVSGALLLLHGLKEQDLPARSGHEAPAWLSACVVGGPQGGSPGAPTHVALGSGRPPGRGLHPCHGGAEAGQAATACEPRGLLRGWNRSGQAGPGDPGPTSVPGRPRAEAVDEDLSQACHAQAPAPWPLASWKEGGEGRDALWRGGRSC